MPIVAVFGSSSTQSDDLGYSIGERCGRLLAEAGIGVATGGYEGMMEAVSRGAASVDGRVIGVTAPSVFSERSEANAHLTVETRAASLLERIKELVEGTDASIALPGSLGTATELMAAWNLAYVARFSDREAKPVVAVGPAWGRLVPLLARELDTDGSLVTCVATADEAVSSIRSRLTPTAETLEP
jgi:uncharacterized protein (TIGR00730 family)